MKLIATIEQGTDGGFAVCVREKPWLLGMGLTKEEAIEDFHEVFQLQIEDYKERYGKNPDWADAELEYRYDIRAFFQAFPFINVSKFAEFVGINPSLMRKYKSGVSFASEKQLSVIQNGINRMSESLESVLL